METRAQKHRLDEIFRLAVIIKGADGLLEVTGGVLLAIIDPRYLDSLVVNLTQYELSRDPNDFIATHVLQGAHSLTGPAHDFGVAYLLIHGFIKLLLAYALLRGRRGAYPLAGGFLGLFILYQVYRIGYGHSAALAFLTIFDLILVWLIWREWKSGGAGDVLTPATTVPAE